MTQSRRFLLYRSPQSGLCREFVSLELAVGLAHLTGRTLVYYGPSGEDRDLAPISNRQRASPPGWRPIVDQARNPTILDLLEDLPVASIPYAQFRGETAGGAPRTFDSAVRLAAAVFVGAEATGRSAALDAFAEGRIVFTDRDEEILHIKETDPSYYARLFFEPDPSVYPVLGGIVAKTPYRDLAAAVCAALGPFNGVHVRLGDFRKLLPYRGKNYPREILKNLAANFPTDQLLVIATNESDNKEFFGPITSHFRRHVFIDEFIVREFPDAFQALPFCDETALALLSNLVLQRSQDFHGTPGSTFSGIIQRQVAKTSTARDRRMLSQAFKFVCSGSATVDVPFAGGRFIETGKGLYSWNRLNWSMEPEAKSRYREWPEAIPASIPETRDVPATVSADTESARIAGWSASSYGRWSVAPPTLPKMSRSDPAAAAFDRAAIERLLQSVGTELLFGGDADAAIARLQSWGAPADEARRIIGTAVADPLIVNGREMAAMLRKRDWLLDSLNKLQQLSPRAKSIERRKELSGGEFLEHYYARNRPAIVTDEMIGWPALSKWSLPFLREAAGTVRLGATVAANDESAVEIAMTEEGFLPLAGDLGALEKYLDRTAPPKGGVMRIAEADAFVPLHSTPRNRLLAQIAGRTQFKIIAAADVAKVYDRHGLMSEIGDLEAEGAKRARFPLVANTRVYDVTLDPGEILFLPLAWWCQMRSPDFGVMLTYVNFRWPNDMHRSFPELAQ